MNRIALAIVVSVSLLLGACAPAVQPQAEPEVAVINAPEEARVSGVASSFASAISSLGTPGFDVVRDVALAGVELRRNLGGSQAVPSAARIGRSFGATYTLMLGAVDVTRDVFESGRDQVRIVIHLSVEGRLVRASDARVIASLESRTFTGQRFAPASEPLPELLMDPLTQMLASRGAASLAPVFREVISDRVSGNSSE